MENYLYLGLLLVLRYENTHKVTDTFKILAKSPLYSTLMASAWTALLTVAATVAMVFLVPWWSGLSSPGYPQVILDTESEILSYL